VRADTAQIADALVLWMTPREALRDWCEQGLAVREWEMMRTLLDSYQRIVLVSPDSGTASDLVRAVPEEPLTCRVDVVSNTGGAPVAEWDRRAHEPLAETLAQARSVVIETGDMCCGTAPVRAIEHLRRTGKAAALVARGGQPWTRFVAHEHGTASLSAQAAAREEHTLCRAADMVIGATRPMIEDLAWRYHLDMARCRVIPKFVLVNTPPAGAEGRDPDLLLFVGRLIARKRVEVLLEAMTLLPEELRARVRLEIIGDGPERPALEAKAAALGAPVTFRGMVRNPDVLRRLRRCALFLLPSALEGLSQCLLEAMSTGAPVLVARAPGLESAVVHGQSGLVLDPTPDAFALAIQEGLRDPDWRDVLGGAAARTARETFGLPVVLPKVLESHRLAMEHAASTNARQAAG
jgi:glycosyltransferase involved in cell wall biosynthesis